MTASNAIEWLKGIEKKYIHGGDEEFDRQRKIAISTAISALEMLIPKETERGILITAINTYGETAQETVAIEECAELIQAICHKHRGRKDNISEEIADVEIMLEQLKMINNCYEEVAEIHKQKTERLYQRVYDMSL